MPMPQEIEPKEIYEVLPQLFLVYAEDVVKNRAIPRIDDGLKPVQRRILYAMYLDGLASNKPHRKCARTIGTVLSLFHAHGDASVYDAMTVMAQDFSMRYPLVDIHGNAGSYMGDPPAAYRYTEGRLSPIAELMLEDIDKNTVEMEPNYDNSTVEPVMLGGYFPNAICNPTMGIAVGVATSFAPHYAGDVFKAADTYLEYMQQDINPDEDELISIIKAPDFPTGGTIINPEDILDIYRTGRGRIVLRAKYRIEETHRRKAIVFYELPYKVAYASLMESLTKLQKEIDEITDIRDESSARMGIRIIVELKNNAEPAWIIQKIFKKTEMQSSYSCNFVAIVDGHPQENVTLKQMLAAYINRCCLTYRNSCIYDIERWKKRLNNINIMLFAADHAEDIIRILKESDSPVQSLTERFSISTEWAESICDTKFRSIAKLSAKKLTEEKELLVEQVTETEALLNNRYEFLEAVRNKIRSVSQNKIFQNDQRRTTIEYINADENDIRQQIKDETIILMRTNYDMIQAVKSSDVKERKNATTGTSTKLRYDEVVTDMLTLSTRDSLLCFTNYGKCYVLPVYKIPIVSKNTIGHRYLSTLLNMDNGEHVVCLIPADPDNKEGKVLVFVTAQGFVKKMDVSQLNTVNRSTKCIIFRENDTLQQVLLCNPDDEIIMLSSALKAVRFSIEQVPLQQKTARGVIGMKLTDNGHVVSALVVENDKSFLTISKSGYVKRMSFDDFSPVKRGAMGVNIGGKDNDSLISGFSAASGQIIVIASKDGKIAKVPVDKYKIHGRAAGGNFGMKLANDDYVVSVSVTEPEEEEKVKAEA